MVVLERLFFLKKKDQKRPGVLFSSCARKFPPGAALKAGSWLLHLPGSRIRATACFFRPRRESYSPEKTSRDFQPVPRKKKIGNIPTCKQLEELKSETTNHHGSEVHERVQFSLFRDASFNSPLVYCVFATELAPSPGGLRVSSYCERTVAFVRDVTHVTRALIFIFKIVSIWGTLSASTPNDTRSDMKRF